MHAFILIFHIYIISVYSQNNYKFLFVAYLGSKITKITRTRFTMLTLVNIGNGAMANVGQ